MSSSSAVSTRLERQLGKIKKNPAVKPSLLIISDFDSTLTENNSDTGVPEALGLKEKQLALWKEEKKKRMQWTNHISYLLAPFGKEEIKKACREGVQIHPGCVRALEKALAQQNEEGGVPCEVHIASDANTLFIDELMKTKFPNVQISSVHTNPYLDLEAMSDDDPIKKYALANNEGVKRAMAEGLEKPKSAVQWYELNGHRCSFCTTTGKANQSKSEVVRRILNDTKLNDVTIVYMGDGSNDCCPIRKVLRPRDFAFVREGFPLEKMMAEDAGNCNICLWKDGDDMERLMLQVIEHIKKDISPLYTFNDDIDLGCPFPEKPPVETFRMPTINTRIPKIYRRCIDSLLENDAAAASTSEERALLESFKTKILEPMVVSLEKNESFEVMYHADLFSAVKTAAEPGQTSDSIWFPPQWIRNYGKNWHETTWLQGEIATQNILLALFNLHFAGALDKKEISSGMNSIITYEGVKRLMTYCSLGEESLPTDAFPEEPKPFIPASRPIPNWFPAPTPLQRSLCYGMSRETDTYRVDKLQSVDKFLQSHILPLLSEPQRLEDPNTIPLVLRQQLWGNAVDLCMFTLDTVEQQKTEGGGSNTQGGSNSPLNAVAAMDSGLITPISDHENLSKKLIDLSTSTAVETQVMNDDDGTPSSTKVVDIVMDNVGIEASSDFLLGLTLVTLAKKNEVLLKVRYHVKPVSYYVSDVCPWDIEILMERLLTSPLSNSGAKEFATRFLNCLEEGTIEVLTDDYWVQPGEWKEMPGSVARKYFYFNTVGGGTADRKDQQVTTVCKTDIVLVKGDLNYRRVFSDRHYYSCNVGDTPALPYYPSDAGAVLGRGFPTDKIPLASLRTVKSELAVGAHSDLLSSAQKNDSKKKEGEDWRATGRYGQILFIAS